MATPRALDELLTDLLEAGEGDETVDGEGGEDGERGDGEEAQAHLVLGGVRATHNTGKLILIYYNCISTETVANPFLTKGCAALRLSVDFRSWSARCCFLAGLKMRGKAALKKTRREPSSLLHREG